ncbi:MAG TPA: acetate--CoA ligase family protein [Methylomirabilota bacterium]|jgi:acetyltransferase
MSDLDALFAPRAVAVLGVSRNPAKLGYRLLQNVKEGGYAGALYPVNPAGESILGCATVTTVEALPYGVDLALVSLPAPAVRGALRALASRRVRAAVVLSSGFGEVDADGRDAEAELIEMARAAGLRLVGPNCMGVFSAPVSLNATYFWDLPRVGGGIGVVSQSGAYGGLVFRHLASRGLGVSRFVSIGNQADVGITEAVEYLVADPATTLIACFVEALRDGERFVQVAARAVGKKPIVVLKGGRSDAGRRAAGSHTGSLAGSHDVFRAACARARIVLAEETEEFFDAIETLVVAGARRAARPRVAVLTVSGGPSVIAADAAEREGLVVPPLDRGTRAALRGLLPSFAAVGNPVDLTPQVEPARIAAAVKIVLDNPDVAGAVAVNVGLDIPEFAAALVAAAESTGKPVTAFSADAPRVEARLRAGGIPVLPSPERAVRAWRVLCAASPPTPAAPAADVVLPADVEQALATGSGPVPYAVARRALEAFGLRFCREQVATDEDAAVMAAAAIGFPVVVKGDAPGLVHKTEAGAVHLDVRDADGVRAACRALRARGIGERMIVQERVGPGIELLLGGRRDPSFGPVVAVGTGGVLTEAIRDVSVRLAPVMEGEAEEMLHEGVRGRLLAGARGLPRVDETALVRAVRAVSAFMAARRRVLEVDVNPVIAAGADVVAVDCVVIVGEAT